MNQRKFRFLMAGMSTAAWVFVGLGLIAGYLNWVKYEPAFTVLNPEKHWVKQVDPKTILVYREFRVTRERQFLFIRELLQGTDSDAVVRIELPTTLVEYVPGSYQTERLQPIPTLKPGRYLMANRVCWKPNILKSECVELPRLQLEIRGDG